MARDSKIECEAANKHAAQEQFFFPVFPPRQSQLCTYVLQQTEGSFGTYKALLGRIGLFCGR